ncbi:MAG: bifunctional riboflavin kinase/FAD synthetase [Bacillota bacterium]
MKICTNPDFKRDDTSPVVIAIGSFDGLHLGHQKIINKTVEDAKKHNLSSGVYSFTPHPLQIINPDKAPDQIISERQKEKKLEQLDIDYYFKQEFTRQFSEINFETFVREILINKINIQKVVVGKDFRFGNNGQGNTEALIKLGKKYAFDVEVLSRLKINNIVVSSSYIRNLIRNGEIKQVPDFLGNYYIIEGKVISGEKRGRKLGFPTANLDLDTNYILPPPGVYAGYVNYEDKKYKAIGNLGYRPTYSGTRYEIEIYILDFCRNIYGEKISFELIRYIREEENFDSDEQLIQQIKRDVLYTKNILW